MFGGDNNDTIFVANFAKITEVLNKSDEAIATPLATFRLFLYDVTLSLVSGIGVPRPKPPRRNMTVRPLVPFDRIARMVKCG